jgi:hypothetical protein
MATITKTAITVSCRVRREYTLLTTMLSDWYHKYPRGLLP